MMTVDRESRTDLRNALVSYMTGEIRTLAFDDRNSPYGRMADRGIQQISRFLYTLHDDLIDHPISVSRHGWAVLRRVVAFLSTDLELETVQEQPSWPFVDESQWRAFEYLLNDIGLPDYDAVFHGRPANPWWNRIPSSVGFVSLAAVIVVVIITLVFL